MLLFTVARKNEVLHLRWPDIDLMQRLARVKRTKNGKPLSMPLPPPVTQATRFPPSFMSLSPLLFRGRFC